MTAGGIMIGLDVGSASTKASAFTIDGKLVAQGSVGYQVHQPEPGVAEYDANELCRAAVGALAAISSQIEGRRVTSIAIDAMMSGAVAINDAGKPVTPYTTTLDTRFGPELSDFVTEHGNVLRREAGSAQATLAPKIVWMRGSRPELSDQVAKYVLAGSLVGGHLAGLEADDHYLDPTYLWTTGLASGRDGKWSPGLMAAAGVKAEQLPRIVGCTDVIGSLSKEMAALTGLSHGIPIVAGCGDQSAGYIGAGITQTGIAADSAGTYAVFAVASPRFEPSDSMSGPDVAVAPVPGLFHYQHVIIGGGLTRQWAADLLGRDADGTSMHIGSLEAQAERVGPGADGLRFVPYLGGTATPPDARIRGGLYGLTWSHGAPEIYRAVLESVALDHAMSRQFLPQDAVIDHIVGYGGGVRSRLWNQIKCDVLGAPYECLGAYPVTELGIALIGAEGVGGVDDAAATARSMRHVEQVLQPDERNHDRYLEIASEYEHLTEQHRALTDSLATRQSNDKETT